MKTKTLISKLVGRRSGLLGKNSKVQCNDELRLDYGDECEIPYGCACFLISQVLSNTYRLAIYKIKAEYHSYQVICMTQ